MILFFHFLFNIFFKFLKSFNFLKFIFICLLLLLEKKLRQENIVLSHQENVFLVSEIISMDVNNWVKNCQQLEIGNK